MGHRHREQSESEDSSSTSSSSCESSSSSSESSDRGIIKFLKAKARAKKNLRDLKKMKKKKKNKKKRVNEKDEHFEDEAASSKNEKKNRKRPKTPERRTDIQDSAKKGGRELPLVKETNEGEKKDDLSNKNTKKIDIESSKHSTHTTREDEGGKESENGAVTKQDETETATFKTPLEFKDMANTEERGSHLTNGMEETMMEREIPHPHLIKKELGETAEAQKEGEDGKKEEKKGECRNTRNSSERENTKIESKTSPPQRTEKETGKEKEEVPPKKRGEDEKKETEKSMNSKDDLEAQKRGEGGKKEEKKKEGKDTMNSNERENTKTESKISPTKLTKKEMGKEKEEALHKKKGEEEKKEHEKNSKDGSPMERMESTSREKSRQRREGGKHTMVSLNRRKRRHEVGEEGGKPLKTRNAHETGEKETFHIHTTEEDRSFFETRSSYRTEDTTAQLREQVPTVELTGRDIYQDMARIASNTRQSYFSLERVANSTDTGLRMCPFYNLNKCTFSQSIHINGIRQVGHFCSSCYTSANVLLGHPVQKCPNLKLRFLN